MERDNLYPIMPKQCAIAQRQVPLANHSVTQKFNCNRILSILWLTRSGWLYLFPTRVELMNWNVLQNLGSMMIIGNVHQCHIVAGYLLVHCASPLRWIFIMERSMLQSQRKGGFWIRFYKMHN